ncbi:hypothetical protein [Persephonella sp.]
MKKFVAALFFLLTFFSFSYSQVIVVKKPVLKNLPRGYGLALLSFLEKHFENIKKYPTKESYQYLIQPIFSWVATSYNICFDIYRNDKLISIYCSTSFSGEELHDDIERVLRSIQIFKRKSEPELKEVYIKLIAKGNLKSDKLKIVSPKGDVLVDYKKARIFKEQKGEFITIGNAIINIDTAYIQNFEATKLLEHLLNNYRIKGILIIKTY